MNNMDKNDIITISKAKLVEKGYSQIEWVNMMRLMLL